MAVDSLRKASTPKRGLEVKPGNRDNWVERHGVGAHGGRGGSLPPYVQHIALALVRERGIPKSRAIGMAVGICKRWARGGGDVDAGTRAAAAKAVAEWEAMKARAHLSETQLAESAYTAALDVLEGRWLPGMPDPDWVRRDTAGKFSTGGGSGIASAWADDDLPTLRRKWGDLDRELLPYAGNPRAREAVRIVHAQKQIIEAIHHKHLDEGGPEGIGMPGGARDVVVVGAGPAGLAAAIYGGTEGLDTLLVDANTRPGGQAAMSSRIENVMGFPAGVTGRQMAETSLEQAKRVGAETVLGVQVQSLTHDDSTGLKRLALSNGQTITTRSVVVAGGVQFRTLDFPGADGKGVVYGDSAALKDIGERAGKPAVLVGGANSAGQAAIDAASTLPHVTIIVRSNIRKGMSSYLVDQLEAAPNVTILEGAEIASAQKDADGNIVSVTLKDGRIIEAAALGLFIGSAPKAHWSGAELDERGYIKTGYAGNPLQSSIPGVFAAGDIRSENKVHRVATAAGEGAMSISLVHQYIPQVTGERVTEATGEGWERDSADRWMDAIYELDELVPFTGLDDESPDNDPRDALVPFREACCDDCAQEALAGAAYARALDVLREDLWDAAEHPRGVTGPGTNRGSFAPSAGTLVKRLTKRVLAPGTLPDAGRDRLTESDLDEIAAKHVTVHVLPDRDTMGDETARWLAQHGASIMEVVETATMPPFGMYGHPHTGTDNVIFAYDTKGKGPPVGEILLHEYGHVLTTDFGEHTHVKGYDAAHALERWAQEHPPVNPDARAQLQEIVTHMTKMANTRASDHVMMDELLAHAFLMRRKGGDELWDQTAPEWLRTMLDGAIRHDPIDSIDRRIVLTEAGGTPMRSWVTLDYVFGRHSTPMPPRIEERLREGWVEQHHPRGKTTPHTNRGSFAPASAGAARKLAKGSKGFYFHEMLQHNVPVTILSTPNQRGRMRVEWEDGTKRVVSAGMVSAKPVEGFPTRNVTQAVPPRGDTSWIDVGDDVVKAADLLGQGKRVRLSQRREVSTLLAELAKRVQDAKAKGDSAPNFDLCKVTVKNTNLFCVESKGIPRVQMPQLSGKPAAGTAADKLPKNAKGEVDLGPAFRKMLADRGVKITDGTEQAAYLRASQSELNGAKVAGMTSVLSSGGKLAGNPRLFVSSDNYIVDGHHRWAANVGYDLEDGVLGDVPMDIARVSMPIIELLFEANEFARRMGIPQAAVHAEATMVLALHAALDTLLEVDWNPALHPRDRVGRFAPKGGGAGRTVERLERAAVTTTSTAGGGARENIGVTPYRGKSKDPGRYRDTARYRNYVRQVQRIAREEGVSVEEFQHVAGLWEGEQEPADSLWVRGPRDAVRRFGLRLGKRYNQDGVMFFDPVDSIERANGALITVPGVPDEAAAYKLLDVLGQPGGRYFDGKVQTAVSLDDVDTRWFEQIARTVEELGLEFEYDWGRVDFPGKPYPQDLREGRDRGVPGWQQGSQARLAFATEGHARGARQPQAVGP